MKKVLVALATLVAAIGIGVATPAPAQALSCGGNSQGYSYAGYETSSLPAIGSYAFADVSIRGGILNNDVSSGHVAGWVGVSEGTDRWIQAGLTIFPGGAEQAYIEVKLSGQPATYFNEGTVSPNTPYYVYIYHVANGVWDAYVNNGSYQVTLGGTMQQTTITGEDLNTPGSSTCNTMTLDFSNVYPWTTGQMAPDVTGSNFLSNVTSSSWTSNS